ncbi:MAG: hypothetical protein HOU81_02065 [Hamadaea sp.]|uniref:hypothetical protein n=1 Tax=Hamadaea sp. TaxID=2024425 RepID=UPI0017D90A58|nr:hypothetical protein [Hamadaea sp.]NUR69583.1 hypothetical protein [Hamadaea sp.]NUT20305.1 hypothetical protein [Hamadaea sp.]
MSAIAYEAPRTRRFAALTDSLWVVGRAGVVFGRHWPVLFTLALTGVAAHDLILLGAVKAALVNSTLGLLVLLLAPVATMISLVLMLRSVRVSLPHLRAAAALETDGRSRRLSLLECVGSIAVPYLAIYEAYGTMRDEFSQFAYEVWRNDPISTLDHLPFSPTAGVISVVVVAVALRFVLGKLTDRSAFGWLSPLGAYLEVVWVATVAWTVSLLRGNFDGWFGQRQVSVWWHQALDMLPGHQLGALLESWFATLWENVDLVILAPVAWLTMGAVVFGRNIEEPKLTDERILTATARRVSSLPVIRMFSGPVNTELNKRFGPLLGSLRMFAKAGLRPMLLFCLVFVLLEWATTGLWELERIIIGPQDLQKVWWGLSYLLSPINTTVRFVVLVCLLGAATDRILQSREAS